MEMRDILQQAQSYPSEEIPLAEDQEDYTVLHYARACTLRGRQGRVLCALPTTSDASANKTAPTPGVTGRPTPLPSSSVVYLLGVDGQGVGEDLDTLLFINAENKDDTGCIRYGDTVALKSPAGKERYVIIEC